MYEIFKQRNAGRASESMYSGIFCHPVLSKVNSISYILKQFWISSSSNSFKKTVTEGLTNKQHFHHVWTTPNKRCLRFIHTVPNSWTLTNSIIKLLGAIVRNSKISTTFLFPNSDSAYDYITTLIPPPNPQRQSCLCRLLVFLQGILGTGHVRGVQHHYCQP